MANFVYVDNSNLWIEGMHVSAVVHGLAPSILIAQEEKISDFDWKLDFGRLYEFAVGGGAEVGRAVIFGSTPTHQRVPVGGGTAARIRGGPPRAERLRPGEEGRHEHRHHHHGRLLRADAGRHRRDHDRVR